VNASRLLSLQAFSVQLEVDVQRAHRYGRALSVALIAVDDDRERGVKQGPAAREAILAAIGQSIANGVRGADLACRTVGGEFAVLFAETRADQASRATRRVVIGLDDVAVAGVRGLSVASAVAELTSNEDPEALLARAREALEQARADRGRQVAIATQPRSTGV
jgi:diguanylate cyclase (GGDEF)-like protein